MDNCLKSLNLWMLTLILHSIIYVCTGTNHQILNCCSSSNSLECQKLIKSWNSSSSWFMVQEHSSGEDSGHSCMDNEEPTTVEFNVYQHQLLNNSIIVQGIDTTSNEAIYMRFKDGRLMLQTPLREITVSISSSCISSSALNSKDIAELHICSSQKDSKEKEFSYRKCCPDDQLLFISADSYFCTSLQSSSSSSGLKNLTLNNSPENNQFPPFLNKRAEQSSILKKPVIGIPECDAQESHNLISTALLGLDYLKIPYFLTENKIKIMEHSDTNRPSDSGSNWKDVDLKSEKYCIDKIEVPKEFLDYSCIGEQDVLIHCHSNEAHSNSNSVSSDTIQTYQKIYIFCLIVAILFLAATILGQFFLIEMRNIHTWTVQFYIFSQLLFYVLLVIIYWNQGSTFLSDNICDAIGMCAHFLGLGTFSWLSVINFDLWWTFRVLQPTNQTKKPWKKLIWYIIFATATPFCIVGFSIFSHFYPEEHTMCRSSYSEKGLLNSWITEPGYGKNELCFLSNSAQLIYFYYPVGFLLLANLIFYSCTSYRLCSLYKKSQNDTVKKHRQSCQLLLKLFCVMGTVWIFQVLHAAIEPHERKWYWTITDMLGIFQAVAIFVIFVCKKETAKAIEKKYPRLEGMCCRFKGLYRRPTITDRSTDGSTKMSRTTNSDYQRKSSIGHQHQWQEPNEIIQLPTVDLISLKNSP